MIYSYSWGYRTRDAAQLALIDMMESGVISQGESPQIVPYQSTTGRTRFKVTLQH
jgi:hypothetical protein